MRYMPGHLLELRDGSYHAVLQSRRTADNMGWEYIISDENRSVVTSKDIVREVAYRDYVGGATYPLMLDGAMALAALDCVHALLENDFEPYGQDVCGACEQELDTNGDGHLLECPVPHRLAVLRRLRDFLKRYDPNKIEGWNLSAY